MKFKIGDVVKIKEGVTIEDIDIPIAGWHGRIIGYEENDLLLLALDSIVLKNLPKDYILETIRGIDMDEFNHFYMKEQDLELSKARDTKSDVERALNHIENEYFWEAEGDGDPSYDVIKKVLKNVEEGEEIEAWENYLEKHLKFPFEAEVIETERGSHYKEGEILTIKSIYEMQDPYGILVNLKREGERGLGQFPLCDMEVPEVKNPNRLIVAAYSEWFVNYYN